LKNRLLILIEMTATFLRLAIVKSARLIIIVKN